METQVKAAIERLWRDELRLAARLLQSGLRAVGAVAHRPRGRFRSRGSAGLRYNAFHVGLSLYVKSSKQFRSLILLCQAGLTEDAEIIARSLFETLLALNFVLRRSVQLKENGKRIKVERHGRRQPLDCGFRTELYLAHYAFDLQRRVKGWKNVSGLKRLSRTWGDPAAIDRDAQQAELAVGPEWTHRLRSRRSFSGLSIRDLADSFGIVHYYASIYGHQSHLAHGADALSYLDLGDEPSKLSLALAPNTEAVGRILRLGSLLFTGCLDIASQRIGLGADKAVKAFIRDLHQPWD